MEEGSPPRGAAAAAAAVEAAEAEVLPLAVGGVVSDTSADFDVAADGVFVLADAGVVLMQNILAFLWSLVDDDDEDEEVEEEDADDAVALVFLISWARI